MSHEESHVTERSDGTIEVGKNKKDECKEKARCDDQMDRIEAKLDLLLEELGVDL